MHIPNHVLTCPVTIATAAAASGGLGIAVRRLKDFRFKEKAARICALFVFIFVAQMVDVPVTGGTTGHFFGGMLAALVVGPAAASLLMASVLLAQCAFLGDGGFTALGANILNMAIVGPWVGWAAYHALTRHVSSRAVRALAMFASAWFSIVASATACALELSASSPLQLSNAVSSMAGIHAIIGLGEGVLTVAVAALAAAAVPELFATESRAH